MSEPASIAALRTSARGARSSPLVSCCLPFFLLALSPALFAQGQSEVELDSILHRLDDEDPSVRDRAQEELSHWSERVGPQAEAVLRDRLAGASPEVEARIGIQLQVYEHIAECRRFVSVFDGLGMPSCAGRELVFYNSRQGWPDPELDCRTCVLGWVLSESAEAITLLEDSLRVRTHLRPALRPQGPAGDPLSEIDPPPGETSPIHFGGWCDSILARAGELSSYQQPGPLPFSAEVALYAWWSFQRDDPRRGVALTELSQRLLDAETRGRRSVGRGRRSTPQEALLDSMSLALRGQALCDAGGGVAREELLDQWRLLDRLPDHAYSEEARARVGQYEDLLAEDAQWKAPTEEALLQMDPSAQAECWMYRLRDQACSEIDDGPDVLDWLAETGASRKPARCLADLGWPALPVVIAHLDDSRPTRCASLSRRGYEYSHLLSHADCCLQVFEAITGIDLPDPPEARRTAEVWWEENGHGGPGPFYMEMLRHGDQARQRLAADALLRLDAARYVSPVVDLARRGHRPLRTHLVWLLRERAGRDQQGFFESVLDDPDDEAVCAAAWALWDTCSSDRGVRELARRLRAWDGRTDGAFPFRACDLAILLSRIRSNFAADTMCDLMRNAPPQARVWVISYAGDFPDPRVLAELVSLLDDGGPTRWSRRDGSSARFCDLAAQEIGEMTGCFGTGPASLKVRWAARHVSEVRAWYAENRDSIDWEALRRSADERRAAR